MHRHVILNPVMAMVLMRTLRASKTIQLYAQCPAAFASLCLGFTITYYVRLSTEPVPPHVCSAVVALVRDG